MQSSAPDNNAAREACDAILRQPDFVAAPRLASFLRYVVDETLKGRSSRLKGFSIAMAVFGRNADFDPQTNSIVRVEAMRLRTALERYYAGAGASDPVEIRMRRGTYVPEFVQRAAPAAFARAPEPVEPAPEVPEGILVPAANGRDWKFAAIGALGLAVVAILGLVIWRVARQTHESHETVALADLRSTRPTISVRKIEIPAGRPDLESFSRSLNTQIEDALSRFENPIVVSEDPAVVAPTYRLTSKIDSVSATQSNFVIRIVHVATGEIIWTREFPDTAMDAGATAAFVAGLVRAISQTYGIVFADLQRRLGSTPQPGFDCVILAFNAIAEPFVAASDTARQCLERTIEIDPGFAPAYTALAHLQTFDYLMGWNEGRGRRPIKEAVALARKAVALEPQKGRAHSALFWAQFFAGRFDEAFASAQIGLTRNPFASDAIARVGVARILRGDFERGEKLMREAASQRDWVPGWEEFFLFLKAQMQGESERARRHALRAGTDNFPLGLIARIIAFHQLGDADAGNAARRRLSEKYPAVAADIPATFDRFQMAPEIRARLIADLAAAGLPVTPAGR